MSLKSIQTLLWKFNFIQIVIWLKLFQQFIIVSVILNSQYISDNTLLTKLAKIL